MELGRVDEAAALIDPAFDRPLRADDDRTLGILDQLRTRLDLLRDHVPQSRGRRYIGHDFDREEAEQEAEAALWAGDADRAYTVATAGVQALLRPEAALEHPLPGSCSPWRPEPARTSPTRADARTRRKPSTPSRGWPRWSPWRRAS